MFFIDIMSSVSLTFSITSAILIRLRVKLRRMRRKGIIGSAELAGVYPARRGLGSSSRLRGSSTFVFILPFYLVPFVFYLILNALSPLTLSHFVSQSLSLYCAITPCALCLVLRRNPPGWYE